jgi:hypothetical protein
VVNLPKSSAPKLDLARTEIIGKNVNWYEPILIAHTMRIVGEARLNELLAMDNAERLYQLGRISAYELLSDQHFWNAFPLQHLPVPLLTSGGHLKFIEWQDLGTDSISELPGLFADELYDLLLATWMGNSSNYTGPLLKWMGEDCVAWSSSIGGLAPIMRALRLISTKIRDNYRLSRIRFLESPWDGEPPIAQEIYAPKSDGETDIDIAATIEKAIVDPTMLNPSEKRVLSKELKGRMGYLFAGSVQFDPPYEKSLQHYSYGGPSLMNIRHPTIKALLRFIAAVARARIQQRLRGDQIGQMEDVITSTDRSLFLKDQTDYNASEITANLKRLLHMATELQLSGMGVLSDLVPSPTDWLISSQDTSIAGWMKKLRQTTEITSFGTPLG